MKGHLLILTSRTTLLSYLRAEYVNVFYVCGPQGVNFSCDLHQHFTNSCTDSTPRCTSAARGTCGLKKTYWKNIFPHIESTVTQEHHVWQLRMSQTCG